jgi:hypothetical protein
MTIADPEEAMTPDMYIAEVLDRGRLAIVALSTVRVRIGIKPAIRPNRGGRALDSVVLPSPIRENLIPTARPTT